MTERHSLNPGQESIAHITGSFAGMRWPDKNSGKIGLVEYRHFKERRELDAKTKIPITNWQSADSFLK